MKSKILTSVCFMFLVVISFSKTPEEIRLRYYGNVEGTITDVSRGESGLFFQKYTGKTSSISEVDKAKAVLQALLEGPTVEERKSGIHSAIPDGTQLLSVTLRDGLVIVDFSKDLVNDGFQDSIVDDITDQLRIAIKNAGDFAGVDYSIEGKSPAYYYPDRKSIKENFYQVKAPGYPQKTVTPASNNSKVVPIPTQGLQGRNIYISGGHGWYYSGSAWTLQRPELYTINEDYSNAATVDLFVIPMLEKAGAYVLTARERDTNINEVIVDNGDGTGNPSNGTYTETGSWSNTNPKTGYANGYSNYTDGQNPFGMGSTRITSTSISESSRATWTPNISKGGDYAVYVSYLRDSVNGVPDGHYFITHTGGTTEMLVNQQIDGQTWLYLGTYHFDSGFDVTKGSVSLVNVSTTAGKIVSADAIRFGGGKGKIYRGGSGTSNYYKYTEDAQYNSQYNGAADSTVYEISGISGDYNWDIATRGEFCNWYNGAPNGPNINRNDPGQGVPIDAMISFHSDAGSYQTSIHGSLTIWYQYDQNGTTSFPDGRDRIALNYAFASTVHYQTISDMRALYTTTWPNDGITNGNYGEVRRPNVPSILVESFSHENMNDVQYGEDPQWRFDLARATYKGLIRFLCSLDSTTAVIMPLPPKDLSVVNTGTGDLRVSWSSTIDPLESTATSVGYVVYKSTDGKGFDNGTLANTTSLVVSGLSVNSVYFFRVTAYNNGGENFPTEVLGARVRAFGTANILVVNGFERISRPEANSDTTGFTRSDPGVWYKFNEPLIGNQTMFVPQSNANHGLSNSVYTTTQELGNTFDYVIQHGNAIADAGYWFDSASKKAVEDGYIQLTSYEAVDWICGEQHQVSPPLMQPAWTGYPDKMTTRFQTFTPVLQSAMSTYLSLGKHLFISGSDIAWDLDGAPYATSPDRLFLNNLIHSDFTTNDATSTNQVTGLVGGIFAGLSGISFDNGNGGIYGVEQPDGILPTSGAVTSMTYNGTSNIAAIQYDPGSGSRIVYLGFPFETIISQSDRDEIMSRIMTYFGIQVTDWSMY